MKKHILITVSYIAEVDDSLLAQNGREDWAEKFEKPLQKFFPRRIEISEDISAEWDGTSMTVLDYESNNCARCAACGSWVADAGKPGYIAGLRAGEYVGGAVLCPECAESARYKHKIKQSQQP